MPQHTPKSIRPIKLTNTLTGKKEDLQTRTEGKLSLYSCGPTVYGLIHIGNLRGGLVADLFFRYFKRVGYDVTYVRNYTDVDDKIIRRAQEEKSTPEEVARKYTVEVEKDFAVAGMLEPTHKTTVTTHIQEIIELISTLIEKGKAYQVETGEVLYSISNFEGYGKLSHKNIDDLQAGIRVEVRDLKKAPLDFSLWKPAKPGEPSWPSPWGAGRPGWHIECSAMARKWLGDQIDIHHGGEDLIFPHHENEIAQTEGATGKDPFVKYWLHHAFLTLSKEKMSKSLGNIFTAHDFLAKYSGEVARYMLLSIHYRSIIDFSEDTIDQALNGLHRIYEAKKHAVELTRRGRARADLRAEGLWGEFVASCESARREIDEHFANDFNTAGALAVLYSLIRDFNRTLSEPLAAATPAAVIGASQLIRVMEEDIGGILGVGRAEPEAALQELMRIRASIPVDQAGHQRPSESEILLAIEERAAARKAKDFNKADSIRKELESKGVLIKDSPSGTTWTYT
ncbi:MAG: cysteine--tRNA ligase [Bdellovibrio sp.]|nr:cysteine--tRNA ligase [Bdellovibrio sp.]